MTETTKDERRENPFGGTPAGGRRRLIRLAIGGGVLLIALAGTYMLTREKEDDAAEVGHDQGAVAAADSAAPVMLSTIEARRLK